jgi:hypothetical protein
MNTQEALREAKRRWGKTACVEERKKNTTLVNPKTGKEFIVRRRFIVGFIAMGIMFDVKGDGDTWADAFRVADERAEADNKRYAKIRQERIQEAPHAKP